MNYRPEIDGLRAIAVLAVVIFHIDPHFLPGGFIGVDIFFVISGFLITSIIRKQVGESRFELVDFYARRIKRLLPLFFAVASFVLIAGFFILLPNPYRILSGDVIAANFFLANFKAIISGNYFESDKIKPLLHLWSLAVEEQFYFVFPLLYIILYKFCRKYSVLVLLVIAFLSLGLAEYMSSRNQFAVYSYFLLPTRMWELMAGCILALAKPLPIKKHNTLFSAAGLLMIFVGCYFINENSKFPGIITLLPVLGTLSIILAGSNGVGVLISHRIFLFIGGISYSMYMWHWPLLMFFKAIFPNYKFVIYSSILFLLLLTSISYLSKKYIEDYFRYKVIIKRSKIFLMYLVTPSIILIAASSFVYLSRGMPSRYNIDEKLNVTATKKCPGLTTGCFITTSKSPSSRVILLGDSHAEHFANLFSLWFDEYQIPLKLYASGGCNFYSDDFYTKACEDIKKELELELENGSSKVILLAKRVDNFWEEEKFMEEFSSYIQHLTDLGHKVVIIKQVPKLINSGFLDKWMQARRYNLEFEDADIEIDENYSLANEAVYERLKYNRDVFFLDFNENLLNNGKIKKYDNKALPLYYNSNHLTAYGAEWIYNEIRHDKNYEWLIKVVKDKN